MARRILNKALLNDESATNKLLELLTCLPLAIVQAVAFINSNQVSISDYVSLIKHDATTPIPETLDPRNAFCPGRDVLPRANDIPNARQHGVMPPGSTGEGSRFSPYLITDEYAEMSSHTLVGEHLEQAGERGAHLSQLHGIYTRLREP